MLQQPKLSEQQRAFRSLRLRLREFVADFGERGTVAQAILTRNVSLLQSASQRWSPAMPASPPQSDVPESLLSRFAESSVLAMLRPPERGPGGIRGMVGSLGAALEGARAAAVGTVVGSGSGIESFGGVGGGGVNTGQQWGGGGAMRGQRFALSESFSDGPSLLLARYGWGRWGKEGGRVEGGNPNCE